MATKHAVGSADINFVRLGIPERLNRAGIIAAFRELQQKIRYGGLSRRERWLHRFDAGVTDLSIMPIGLFEAKAIILPRKHLPQTRKALLSFCRQLIDRGENEGYIAIVLRGWPDGWSLERHVDVLWSLRENHRRFFEDAVRGRHRRALSRLNEVAAAGALTEEGGRDLIHRQGLLWCAMDAQMVTCGARASMIMPFGRLIRMTMKVFKAGTALRLMHGALSALEIVCGQYQTSREEEKEGKPRRAKPKGTLARLIYGRVAEKWPERGRTPEEDRADLDDGISYIRGRLPEMRARMSFYEHYLVEDDGRGTGGLRKDNRLRHFHAIWYSGLSPAAGMAVALTRLAMAERSLGELVALAADRVRNGTSGELLPLPPLPTDLKRLREIEERVLDLAHAARIVHLRDEDCLSRTRKRGQSLEQLVASDPDIVLRDPNDKAGLTFVRDAFAFLYEMGQRPRDAHVRRPGRDPRLYTYWKMDCVPEVRLTW
jgi:hypothetical protein